MPRGGKREGAGRPKGSVNTLTKEAKDVISQAANELGGSDRLVSWAKEDKANEKIFWGQIYPKLLPYKLEGSGEGGGLVLQLFADIAPKETD